MLSQIKTWLVAAAFVVVSAVGVLGGADLALAQTPPPAIDVTAATALISGDVTTAIRNIGLGLIALAAIVLGLRWIKASFF